MSRRRQQFGAAGETLAARHLQALGYRILERNFRTPLGEIDIIARQRHRVVFVEVKARRSVGAIHPKLAVDRRKQHTLTQAAQWYLKASGQTASSARFDVVTVIGEGARARVEVIVNAFEPC